MAEGSFERKTEAVLYRFNEGYKPDALAELVADDRFIENTQSAPAGAVTQGGEHFRSRRSRRDPVAAAGLGGEHADYVRGVNLMRVRDGRMVEAEAQG